jgi:hypothetical protein
MSLAAQAEADLATVLEAGQDFGVPFVLTDPAGFASAEQLRGGFSDIGQVFDPGTGAALSGRHATVTARMSTLAIAGYGALPEGVIDEAELPWLVDCAGPSTASQRYKVVQTFPDRTLGLIVLVLSFWNPA